MTRMRMKRPSCHVLDPRWVPGGLAWPTNREPSAGRPVGSHAPAGLADHLLAGVAVHPFGGRVPARDDAIGPDADVGFLAELDDRRQLARPVVFVVCLLAVGQIVHRRYDQEAVLGVALGQAEVQGCLLYTSPSPRD